MAKILLVEDDISLCQSLESWLKHQHYAVEIANTGSDAKALIDSFPYDIIILDWALPDITGIDLLKHFRKSGGRTPVLMLTGKRDISDKEMGLDLGADDYLTKPFDVAELSARIRALLRRPQIYLNELLTFADVTLDPVAYKVTKSGAQIKLYPREFSLLEFLMRNSETVFRGEDLIDRVWQSDSGASLETLRTSIRRLRKQIDTEGKPSLIENVFAVGYKLRLPDS